MFMKKMFVASLGILMVLSSCSFDMKPPVATQADLDAAKTKAETFINDNLMGNGRQATIKEVTDDTDAYKLKVDIGSGQEVVSYLSKDLKKFYPEAMIIAEVEAMDMQIDVLQLGFFIQRDPHLVKGYAA